MRRAAGAFALVVCASCVDGLGPSRLAVPIKSACTASSRSASSVGFDVRPGRRHSASRSLFVTNLTDAPHRVRVQQVSRVEGSCAGEWARQTPLEYVDAETCEAPPEMTIAPKQWVELQIDDQRVSGTWDCTKLGLALWMQVDDQVVCSDAGAWIATR